MTISSIDNIIMVEASILDIKTSDDPEGGEMNENKKENISTFSIPGM